MFFKDNLNSPFNFELSATSMTHSLLKKNTYIYFVLFEKYNFIY